MTAVPFFGDLVRVAEVLTELSDEIERIGASLCMDPAISTDHIGALQKFDVIAQQQRGIAVFLQSDGWMAASAAIGLEDLKDRLGFDPS